MRGILPRGFSGRSPLSTNAAVVLLLCLCGAAIAGAQEPAPTAGTAADPRAVALDRFEPSDPASPFASVQSPSAGPETRFAAQLLGSYAAHPLVGQGSSGTRASIISRQAVLHAQLAAYVHDFLTLDIDVPSTWLSGGQAARLDDTPLVAPDPVSLHDVRLGGRLAILTQSGWSPAVGLALRVWLPTGDSEAYTSAGRVRHALHALIGSDYAQGSYRISIGRRQHGARDELRILPSDTALGLAAGYRPMEALFVGAELDLLRTASSGPVLARASANAEALATAALSSGPWTLRVGAGPGLGSAPGTPRFRALMALAYVSSDRFRDAARDELRLGALRRPSAADAAPRRSSELAHVPQPAVVESPLPPAEAGGQLGVVSRGSGNSGTSSPEAGDVVEDAEVDCPNNLASTNGRDCVREARLHGDQLELAGEVSFASGSDVIEPSSEVTLAAVARLLGAHLDIARIAVDGHTDGVGSERSNLVLSQRRAIAVVRWLVAAGVDERRLEARGLGPRQPKADNDTEAGRLANRRVEFIVIRRDLAGPRGWKDGATGE